MKQKEVKIPMYNDLKPIAAIESGEEMVDLSIELKDCICQYEQIEMTPYTGDSIYIRKTIANKLKNVADNLKKKNPNYNLKIVYGYRHPDIQKMAFERRKNFILIDHPNLEGDELDELANTMTANPNTAGHPTGGAVDLTITTPNGDLDMGCGISDFSDPNKIVTFCDYITETQKENRKLLLELMLSENFAPFYGEWWHFSYGDKEWAWFYEKPNAIYSQTNFSIK